MLKIKKLLSIAFCLVLIFITVAIGGAEVYADEDNEAYSVGDTIYFGTYPQTDVTESLGSVLDSQSGTWQSYGYYFGSGNADSYSYTHGQMSASDYMRYKDVTYNGKKYRGVLFDSYRPKCTGLTPVANYSYQDENGYTTGTTYWFKFEPIEWRVLDPESGFIMCNSIIDSQPYNNYVFRSSADSEYYGDWRQTYYASNYVKSSIRVWLNTDFYNTAFSEEEKFNIVLSNLNNSTPSSDTNYSALPTNDRIFLLSYSDVKNRTYGFDSDGSTNNKARRLKGTDYAKCQGLWVYRNSGSDFDGSSYWLERTPVASSDSVCRVEFDGSADIIATTYSTVNGIVPALRLDNLKNDNTDVFTATFMSEGEVVGTVEFSKDQTSITEPPIPSKDGFIGKWEEYTLKNEDIIINAIYTAVSPETKYTYTFMADGKVVKTGELAAGATIPVPPTPTKDGYTFKGWNPAVSGKMPASDITFTAVFEKKSDNTPTEPDNPNEPEKPTEPAKPTKPDKTTKPDKQTNPNASAKIKVKSDSVYKDSKVTVTAKAEGVPKGYILAIYDGKKEILGDNKSVTYEIKDLVSKDKKLTVKVIDKDGNVQKNAKGEDLTETIEISVKPGFLNAIIAFFRKLFRANTVKISA